MAKRNSTYWQQRFRQLENVLHTDITKLQPDIDRRYKQAQAEIEKEIRAWYQRIAANNDISMSEARRLLSASELDEFKWSVEDYITHGKENALDQRWMKQLENASAKYHISRLEALKFHTQQSLEKVYGNQLDMIDRSMRDLYQDGYYRTVFEIQKGFGIGWPVGSIDENKLEKIIRKPWAADGKNFSERIWSSRDKLVNELHTELTRMCITGSAPDQAIKNISKKINTSRYHAGRLVMTEAAYFGSASQKDCFNDLDVEQYEICATLDSHTSEICQEMDGKVFDMKDYEPGVTAPPFHVFCRSCTVPYFNDEFTADEMRAARGEDSKTYYVPADMKYPEWEKAFVDGEEGDIEKYLKDILVGNTRKKVKVFKNSLPAVENKDVRILLEQSLERTEFETRLGGGSKYRNGKVFLGNRSNVSTIAHELFHEIDHVYKISERGVLKDVIQSDWENLKKLAGLHGNSVAEMLYLTYPDAFYLTSQERKLVYDAYRGISDILSGMSQGQIMLGYFHKSKYWEGNMRLEKETWAQFGRILYENNTDVVLMAKKIFPNTYKEVLHILKEMAK